MTSSWRQSSAREGHGAPVEMRFVDMFMTALGSLVFIALLLVFLLPKTAEVFLAGTISDKHGNVFTLTTGDGKTRKITLGAETKVRHDLAAPIGDFKPGKTMIAAGKASPDGSIAASIIHTPLEGSLVEKYERLASQTELFVSGKIITHYGSTLVLRDALGRETTVLLDDRTKLAQMLGATLKDVVLGRDAQAVGKLNLDGSLSAAALQVHPEADPVAALRAEVEALRTSKADLERRLAEQRRLIDQLQQQLQTKSQQVTELERLIATLRARIAELEAQARQTEDVDIMKRWFSVWLVMDGCDGSDVFFYVRPEGKLISFKDKRPVKDAEKFNADDVIQSSWPNFFERTVLFSDRYEDITISGSSSKMQVKVFHSVSRSGGDDRVSRFSIYTTLKKPSAFADRRCHVQPIFISHQGKVSGTPLSLSILRPFSWIKQFEIRGNATNSLTLPLTESAHAALLAFSRDQSARLCHADKIKICGAEDALLYAIRKEEFSHVAQPRLFDFKPLTGHEFQYSRHIKEEPQKAKDLGECERRCRESPTCASYTYFRKSHPNVPQFCRLMENAGHEIFKSDHADSGVKVVLRK